MTKDQSCDRKHKCSIHQQQLQPTKDHHISQAIPLPLFVPKKKCVPHTLDRLKKQFRINGPKQGRPFQEAVWVLNPTWNLQQPKQLNASVPVGFFLSSSGNTPLEITEKATSSTGAHCNSDEWQSNQRVPESNWLNRTTRMFTSIVDEATRWYGQHSRLIFSNRRYPQRLKHALKNLSSGGYFLGGVGVTGSHLQWLRRIAPSNNSTNITPEDTSMASMSYLTRIEAIFMIQNSSRFYHSNRDERRCRNTNLKMIEFHLGRLPRKD